VVKSANPSNGVFHDPPPEQKHAWLHDKPTSKPKSLRIYEAHVGMSSEEHRCGTYREFADDVLPRVAALGYNAVQLMAVADHAYYACFGYQVTNFFAVAHRSGGPEVGLFGAVSVSSRLSWTSSRVPSSSSRGNLKCDFLISTCTLHRGPQVPSG
jgi:hypothetical protein